MKKIFFFLAFSAVAFLSHAQIWKPVNKFDTVLRKFNIEGGKAQRAYQVRQLHIHYADSLFGYTERWIGIRIFLDANKKRISQKLSDHIDPEPIR